MFVNTIINPKVIDTALWSTAPDILTAETAAPLLRMSRSSVYVLFREPGFPLVRVRKRKYVYKAELYAWVQSYQQKEGVSIG